MSGLPLMLASHRLVVLTFFLCSSTAELDIVEGKSVFHVLSTRLMSALWEVGHVVSALSRDVRGRSYMYLLDKSGTYSTEGRYVTTLPTCCRCDFTLDSSCISRCTVYLPDTLY